jgi:hypothetical protein
MEEDAILMAFIALPAALFAALVLFHRFRRRHPRLREGPGRLMVGNLLFLAALLSVLLPGGEIYFRFLHDSTDSFGVTRVSREWFGRHYEMNYAGFRDSQPLSGPVLLPGRRRVTIFGDSFTVGQGVANVEDRFANIIRNQRPDRDVQVIAVNGWDTPHQLGALRGMIARGWRFHDVVLVYCLNDIACYIPEWQAVLARVFGTREPGFLVRHSYLFDTLHYRHVVAREPDLAGYFDFVRAAYDRPCFREHVRDLLSFRDLVKARRGRLLVVTFPFLHSIGPGDPHRRVYERLHGFWQGIGVPDLDLYPVFENMRPADLVVGPHDAHPNETAHRLAAAAILDFLE